ncbi:hypothetical protein AVEN_18823-1 [Araneus ventricosus]|uniref:Uncharacterized protein n=1 Tax=Araneus ventricosus TaxID=182803 RepID=A0A4Y2REU5_ARAVE|nr:hypothetical protein AVEN_18823-1 [Araneus ventricosus]
MIRQKSKFQPQKGTTGKLNVLTSSESSQSDSDDIFQPQSLVSRSGTPVHKPTTSNSTTDYTSLSRKCDRYGAYFSHRFLPKIKNMYGIFGGIWM